MSKVTHFWRSPAITTPVQRVLWLIIILVRLILIAALFWGAYLGDITIVGMILLTLASSFVPTFVERYYKVSLPIEYHLVVVAFIFASLFVGSVGRAYDHFWWWDLALHGSSGIVLGFIGFLVLYVLQSKKKISLSPALIAFFSFCAAMTAGVVWEFFEFGMDQIFGLNMQKGELDTMGDLIVDAVGALIIAVIAWAYYKKQHGSPIERLVASFVRLNPQLFK